MRCVLAFVAAIVLSSFPLFAQTDSAGADTTLSGAPRVYIDCSNSDCDMDYLRTEITFVNFVRDRAVADIHVLLAEEDNAAGGDNVKIEFIGKGQFDGMRDTLQFFTQPGDTDDKTRQLLANTIRLGLMRFVARTPVANDVTISFARPTKQTAVTDKWKYWVFEISLNGWFQGQKSYKEWSTSTNWTARRVTEKNRFNLSFYVDHSEEVYKYNSLRSVKALQSEGGEIQNYWGLDNHWSLGSSGGFSASEYSNLSAQFYAYGAVEYSIFPYKESTRREIQLRLAAMGAYNDYIDETIYNKTHQVISKGEISVDIKYTQPWGSTGIYAEASDYFHNLDFYRLYIQGELSLRLIAGFAVNLNGSAAKIHDQLSLAKAGASDEDVLLQRRQLATSYQYYLNVGISYTFGSVYTNIVNPRFGW